MKCYRCSDSPCTCEDNVTLYHGDSVEILSELPADQFDLVVTDPPYGVKYVGGCPTNVREKLAGDEDAGLYWAVLPQIFRSMKDGAALYLFYAESQVVSVRQATTDSGFTIRTNLVWVKNQAQMGRWSAQYKHRHEPIIYAFKAGHPPNWYGPTNEETIWQVKRSARNEYHSTQKPVALIARAIVNSSKIGDVVLDAFAGSGSCGVACKQLKRRCVLIELNEGYCEKIAKRLDATRVGLLGHEVAEMVSKTRVNRNPKLGLGTSKKPVGD